jgi:hypothetical protein
MECQSCCDCFNEIFLTSCLHKFCETCFKEINETGKSFCPICKELITNYYIESFEKKSINICSEHQLEFIYYCHHCHKLICSKCCNNFHLQYLKISIKEAFNYYKKELKEKEEYISVLFAIYNKAKSQWNENINRLVLNIYQVVKTDCTPNYELIKSLTSPLLKQCEMQFDEFETKLIHLKNLQKMISENLMLSEIEFLKIKPHLNSNINKILNIRNGIYSLTNNIDKFRENANQTNIVPFFSKAVLVNQETNAIIANPFNRNYFNVDSCSLQEISNEIKENCVDYLVYSRYDRIICKYDKTGWYYKNKSNSWIAEMDTNFNIKITHTNYILNEISSKLSHYAPYIIYYLKPILSFEINYLVCNKSKRIIKIEDGVSNFIIANKDRIIYETSFENCQIKCVNFEGEKLWTKNGFSLKNLDSFYCENDTLYGLITNKPNTIRLIKLCLLTGNILSFVDFVNDYYSLWKIAGTIQTRQILVLVSFKSCIFYNSETLEVYCKISFKKLFKEFSDLKILKEAFIDEEGHLLLQFHYKTYKFVKIYFDSLEKKLY